jgi:hypothetical protein
VHELRAGRGARREGRHARRARRLRANGARLDVAVRAYAADGCKLVGGARDWRGQRAGTRTLAAVGRTLPALGSVADLVPTFPVARASWRARAARRGAEAGELLRAWRALEGDASQLANELRGRIDVLSADRAARVGRARASWSCAARRHPTTS